MNTQLIIIAVIIVVYAIIKAVAKTASETKSARGAVHTQARPHHVVQPPAMPKREPAACPPPVPAEAMSDSEAVAHFAPAADTGAPKRPKGLPGGLSARDAVIWGEVLRRRF